MSEKIRDDLMADLQRIAMRPARPAPSPSPVVEVSEEMVLAAFRAYNNEGVRFSCNMEAMRAALIAALRVR